MYICIAHRVQNTSGPSAPPLPALEQLRYDLNPPSSSWNRFKMERGVVNSSTLFGLSERLSNVEQFTDLYGGRFAWHVVVLNISNFFNFILFLFRWSDSKEPTPAHTEPGAENH